MTVGGGKYLAGFKENQKEFSQTTRLVMKNKPILFKCQTLEKEHGRIESRKYEFYDILEMKKDERWNECQIKPRLK